MNIERSYAYLMMHFKRLLGGIDNLFNEDSGCDHACPEPFLVTLGRLNDMGSPYDETAGLVELLPLLPCLVRVEGYSQGGREHRCREILGVFPRLLPLHPVVVVLGEVAVAVPVVRDGEPNRGGDQPVWLVRLIPGHDAVYDLTRGEAPETLVLRDDLAVGGEYARHIHEVELLYAGVAERELEGSQSLCMPTPLTKNTFVGIIDDYKVFKFCNCIKHSGSDPA